MPEFNPVLVKELRGRMRGSRAFVLLTVYLAILGGVTLLLYIAVARNAGNSLNAGQQIGQALFLVISTVALIEVCMITPSLTAGGIAGEKERQTYDLLIASQLSPWQIVWGKLGAALAFAMLLVVSIVPLISLAFLFGGVSLTELVIALVGLMVTAVFYACIGLFWSVSMNTTLAANSLALGSILLMLLGIPFLWGIFILIFNQMLSDWMQSVPFLYASGAFLSVHPFIALGLTEIFLRQDYGTWIVTLPLSNGNQADLPSPWLAYVVLALLLSALLVLLSVRRIRPQTSAPPRRRRQAQD